MHRIVLPFLAAIALGGCANGLKTTALLGPERSLSYDCSLPMRPKVSGMHHRTVVIQRDGSSKRLVLNLDKSRRQLLEPVVGATGQLFSNSLFAWRVDGQVSTLTDVENIETYACRPVGDAGPAEPSVTRKART